MLCCISFFFVLFPTEKFHVSFFLTADVPRRRRLGFWNILAPCPHVQLGVSPADHRVQPRAEYTSRLGVPSFYFLRGAELLKKTVLLLCVLLGRKIVVICYFY